MRMRKQQRLIPGDGGVNWAYNCYKCRRGKRSLGVVIQAVSEGVILQNERSYLERKYRPYLCFPEASEGPDIDGILEYKAA